MADRSRETADALPGARRGERPLRIACLLFLFLFLAYNANLRLGEVADAWPARHLPFSFLLNHNAYLDDWVRAYLWNIQPPVFVVKAKGHWVSSYPLVTPVLVTPLYAAPSWWANSGPATDRSARVLLAGLLMEKISAALLAALSCAVLFLALRKVLSTKASVLIALVYALASNTWTVSSQNLSLHGLGELSFAFLLWALLRRDGAEITTAFLAGTAIAVAAANRPPTVLLAAPLLVYFATRQRERVRLTAAFLAPLAIAGSIVLALNSHLYGNLVGGYSLQHAKMGFSSIASAFEGNWLKGAAGLLVSPSRGLFIYSPWTLFAVWGAVTWWRQKPFPWVRHLIVGSFLLFALFARYKFWWGGPGFGPRYLIEVLPLLAIFLVPVWPSIRKSRLIAVTFAVAVAASLWVQTVGAFYYTLSRWDDSPTINAHPERLWDWRDSQLARNWKAGRAYPDVPALIHVVFVLQERRRNAAAPPTHGATVKQIPAGSSVPR